MTSTVDGLITGLGTTQLISQLMQVESQPQTALKSKVSTEQKVIGSYQSINGKMAALRTAAEALTKVGTWQAARASSSSDAVTATATDGATTGDLTFDVKRLASAHVLTLSPDALGAITSGAGLDIRIGTAGPVHVDVGTNTAAGAAAAINAKAMGVRASVVNTDDGPVVQLTAAQTGTDAAFTVDGYAETPDVVRPGVDAQIQVGDPDAGGYTVSSSTNAFTGVLPGVTFTATRLQTGVTLSVTSDTGKLADRMQSLVDAANAALTDIGSQTAYDPATRTGKPLAGNFTVRQLEQSLLSSVSNGKALYGSFKQLGVALDRGGKLTFDRAAFLTAYQADPAKTQAAVTTGLADPTKIPPVLATGLADLLQTVAKAATDTTTGTLTLAIQGRTATVKSLNDQIDGWDTRLASRQAALQHQYASLEVALGKLKSQSSWLSGQISTLPTGG
jgi:flagellar hook-associated protein 2